MAIPWLRLDRVMLMVPDLDEAVARWSQLLGAEFRTIEVEELGVRAALSDTGIELVSSIRSGEENAVQPNANGVLAGVCFRVSDIDEAKREAQALGLRIYPGFDVEAP